MSKFRVILVLMIAVSAWGQSKPQSKTCSEWICGGESGKCIEKAIHCPDETLVPHKPKLSSKKERDRNRYCVSPQDDQNTDCMLPNRTQISVSDTCDGLACTGPVEMLPQKTLDIHQDKMTSETPIGEWHLDPDGWRKSVEPCCGDGGWPNQPERFPIVNGVPVDSVNLAIRDAPDGSQAIMLTSSEYSHLQQLRAAVVEEEKRLAVKYGATPRDYAKVCSPHCYSTPNLSEIEDRYEFHGQFLLIDKGGK